MLRKKYGRLSCGQSGFTLVELLVSMSVVGLLVSVSLPAIQSVRESARRTDCTNRIRQIGVAMLNYESAHQAFPPGQIGPTHQELDDGYNFEDYSMVGHLGFVLPYLELGALKDKFARVSWNDEYSTSWFLEEELWQALAELDSFKCPSDRREAPQLISTARSGSRYYVLYCSPSYRGWTNYVGCNGSFRKGNEYHYEEGIFFSRSKIGYAQITDGSSNTVLLGEAIGGSQNYTGEILGEARKRHSVFSNGIGGVNGFFEGFQLDGSDESLYCFSSRHAGEVANFAFADGSVRPVSRTVEYETLSSLFTRARGEVVLDF